MPLVGINNPNPTQPKKSTLDKVAQGFDIATGVLGVGLKAADVYDAFEKTKVAKDSLAVERSKLGIDLGKLYVPTTENDPEAIKFEGVTGAGDKPVFWKKAAPTISSDDFGKVVAGGYLDPLKPEEAQPLIDSGDKSVRSFNTDFGKVYGKLNLERANKKFIADTQKTENEAAKIAEETNQLKNKTGDDQNKEIDNLYKQRTESEAYKNFTPIRTALDNVTRLRQQYQKDPNSLNDVSDNTLVSLYSQVLNPTQNASRQNTLETLAQSGDLTANAAKLWNRVTGGGGAKLTPKERGEFLDEIEQLAHAQSKDFYKSEKGFLKEAKSRKLDPSRVIREYDPNQIDQILNAIGESNTADSILNNFNMHVAHDMSDQELANTPVEKMTPYMKSEAVRRAKMRKK